MCMLELARIFPTMCARIFSATGRTKTCSGKRVRLNWKTGNTEDLLRELDAGILDFVVGYGEKNERGVEQEGLSVSFSSFEYNSRMVLVVHPDEPLWRKDDKDFNINKKNYWERLKRLAKEQKEQKEERAPKYADLKSVSLDEVDFGRTKLIVARSWYQAPGLKAFFETKDVEYVESFEEALALARFRLGAAVLPEVYNKRFTICPFKLVPEDRFTLWIGAYYNNRFAMSEEVYKLLAFVEAYFRNEEYKLRVRSGKPARYDDPGFNEWCEKWCEDFPIRGDWHVALRRDFPLRRSPGAKRGSSREEKKDRK